MDAELKGKSPSFPFYVRDWLTDADLNTCSLADKGLWITMLCYMHLSPRRGYLCHSNGNAISDLGMASLAGIRVDVGKLAWQRLLEAGVFSVDADGVAFNRRMVKESMISEIRKAAGRMGGNPNLVNQNENFGYPKSQPKRKQNPTPASASASASAYKTESVEKVLQYPDATDDSHPNGALVQNTDAAFQELIGVFLACGIGISEPDMRRCCTIWVGLELGQKIQALAVAKESATGEWRSRDAQFIPRPWNFLGERHFERGAPVRVICKQTEKQAGFERAAARFLAGDKEL